MRADLLISICALLIAFFGALDIVTDEEQKRAIVRLLAPRALHLQGPTSTSRPANHLAGSQQFLRTILQSLLHSFDKIFTSKSRLVFVGQTAIFTVVIAMFQFLFLYTTSAPVFSALINAILSQDMTSYICYGVFLCATIMGNYFSLRQTRFFLRLMYENIGFKYFLMFTYCDLMLTLSIFIVTTANCFFNIFLYLCKILSNYGTCIFIGCSIASCQSAARTPGTSISGG